MELENIFFNSKAFFFSLSHPSVFFNSISIFFGNNIDHLLLFSVCGQPFVHSSLNPRNILNKKNCLRPCVVDDVASPDNDHGVTRPVNDGGVKKLSIT